MQTDKERRWVPSGITLTMNETESDTLGTYQMF